MAPTKGNYDVQPQSGQDNSMRLCVMTLLVFFFICLVLLLVPLLLKKNDTSKVPDDYDSSAQVALLVTTESHETIQDVTHSTLSTAERKKLTTTNSQQPTQSQQSETFKISSELTTMNSSPVSDTSLSDDSSSDTQTISSHSSSTPQITLYTTIPTTQSLSSSIFVQYTSQSNMLTDAPDSNSTTQMLLDVATSATVGPTTLDGSSPVHNQNTLESSSNDMTTKTNASISSSTPQIPLAIHPSATTVSPTTLNGYYPFQNQNMSENSFNNMTTNVANTNSTTQMLNAVVLLTKNVSETTPSVSYNNTDHYMSRSSTDNTTGKNELDWISKSLVANTIVPSATTYNSTTLDQYTSESSNYTATNDSHGSPTTKMTTFVTTYNSTTLDQYTSESSNYTATNDSHGSPTTKMTTFVTTYNSTTLDQYTSESSNYTATNDSHGSPTTKMTTFVTTYNSTTLDQYTSESYNDMATNDSDASSTKKITTVLVSSGTTVSPTTLNGSSSTYNQNMYDSSSNSMTKNESDLSTTQITPAVAKHVSTRSSTPLVYAITNIRKDSTNNMTTTVSYSNSTAYIFSKTTRVSSSPVKHFTTMQEYIQNSSSSPDTAFIVTPPSQENNDTQQSNIQGKTLKEFYNCADYEMYYEYVCVKQFVTSKKISGWTANNTLATQRWVEMCHSQRKTCITGYCKNLASRMLIMMNHTADKCEDFYEYACGGLRSNDLLLEDDPKANAMAMIEEQLLKFENNAKSAINATYPFYAYYTSCITYYDDLDEEKRESEARSLLGTMGSFYEKNIWNQSDTTVLTELIYKLTTNHSTPLFDVLLDVDTTDTSKFALKLVTAQPPYIFKIWDDCPPDLSNYNSYKSLDLKSLYSSYTQCIKNKAESEYIESVTNAVETLGGVDNDKAMDIGQDTASIRELWSKAMVSEAVNQYEQLSKKFETKTVIELQADINMIDWKRLFSKLLSRGIPGNTTLQVYFYENFKKFFATQQGDMGMKLHNALLAMFAQDLYSSMVQPTAQDNRENYCLRLADSLMEEFSSALYLSSFETEYLETIKNKVTYIFKQLQDTFTERVANHSSISDTSKRAMIRKMKSMELFLPATSINETFLQHRLANMNIVMDKANFFNNTITLLKRYRAFLYGEYNKNPKDPEQIWTHFLLPHSTVGISIYGLNAVAVPFGIAARKRDFHQSKFQFLKHAYLGGIVGRLVARHFANTGVKYGPDGRLEGTGSIIDKDEFTLWNESYFIDPHQTWPLPDGRNVTLEVDDILRNLWLDELMADQSGIKLAFETYKRLKLSKTDEVLPFIGMDTEELFFLSAAQVFCTKATVLDAAIYLFQDEHLPSPTRVNFFISNSHDFGPKYCSAGEDMNPDCNVKVIPLPENPASCS